MEKSFGISSFLFITFKEQIMSESISALEEELTLKQSKMIDHPVFSGITDIKRLQAFMLHHVYCVWDFMSLAKRLQMDMSCVQLPWIPVADPEGARLINEIILEEESDIDQEDKPTSHLELYLKAMKEIGADTSVFEKALERSASGDSEEISKAWRNLQEPISFHCLNTINIAMQCSTVEVLGAFYNGREGVIPDMFRNLLKQFGVSEEKAPTFHYYVNRHIELDGDSHGPKMKEFIDRTIKTDEERILYLKCSISAVDARIKLWDHVYYTVFGKMDIAEESLKELENQ